MSTTGDITVTERIAACMVAVLLSTSGCRPAADPAPLPVTNACIVFDDTARSRITIGIAGASTPPSMPHGGDLAAAQMFDTLVRVDCTGSVVAGLADTWTSDDSVTWRFTIEDGATFSDGTAVTASSIVESWAARQVQFASVTVIGSELHVTLRSAAGAHTFALPELAISRSASDHRGRAGWPAGTGAYRLDTVTAGMLRLLARAPQPAAADTIDVRYFRGDPRNALDAGVDVIVTGDAAALSYARARGYRSTPLPWKRTYVLATRSTRTAEGGAGSGDQSAVDQPDADELAGMARDAAPGVARRAMSPFWWQQCVLPAPAPGRFATDGQILYEQGDDTARRLAERVTALAWPRADAPAWLRTVLGPYDAPPVSRAASRADLIDAVRTRTGLAVVTSLPRSPHDGCAAITADLHAEALLSFPGRHITPLIDTREHLIHRSGIGRVRVDSDGMIRFGAR